MSGEEDSGPYGFFPMFGWHPTFGGKPPFGPPSDAPTNASDDDFSDGEDEEAATDRLQEFLETNDRFVEIAMELMEEGVGSGEYLDDDDCEMDPDVLMPQLTVMLYIVSDSDRKGWDWDDVVGWLEDLFDVYGDGDDDELDPDADG